MTETPIGFLQASQICEYLSVTPREFKEEILTRSDFPKAFPPPGDVNVWSKDEIDQWMFSLRTKNAF